MKTFPATRTALMCAERPARRTGRRRRFVVLAALSLLSAVEMAAPTALRGEERAAGSGGGNAAGSGEVAAPGSAPAGESAASGDDSARWQALYRQVASEWTVRVAGDAGAALPLHDEPILNWASLDDFNGSVFVWTQEGRPALVGTVFSHTRGAPPPQRQVVTEFQSLSPDSLRLVHERRGSTVLEPGHRPQRIDEAPPSAARPALLKLQTRKLAARFSAHMQHEGERWELRRLPRPLIEYGPAGDAAEKGAVRAGGLFAFTGFITDPEVLLVVEARTTDRPVEWFFQPFRFSHRPLFVEQEGRAVWTSGAADGGEDDNPPGSYHLVPGARLMSLAELEGE